MRKVFGGMVSRSPKQTLSSQLATVGLYWPLIGAKKTLAKKTQVGLTFRR